MSKTRTAIVEWAARHAPDVTDPELAVSLGMPLRQVQRLTIGISSLPEAGSKLRDYRQVIGRLAEHLYQHTEMTLEEIAEIGQCTRQHLHKCREEARRG